MYELLSWTSARRINLGWSQQVYVCSNNCLSKESCLTFRITALCKLHIKCLYSVLCIHVGSSDSYSTKMYFWYRLPSSYTGANWLCLPRETFSIIFRLYKSYISARHEMSWQASYAWLYPSFYSYNAAPSCGRAWIDAIIFRSNDLKPQKTFQTDVSKY